MRFPGSTSIQTVNDSSGVRIVTSEAEFTELPRQIEDVILFLREHYDEIRRLTSFPGVEGAILDFGVDIYPARLGIIYFSTRVAIARRLGRCFGLPVRIPHGRRVRRRCLTSRRMSPTGLRSPVAPLVSSRKASLQIALTEQCIK